MTLMRGRKYTKWKYHFESAATRRAEVIQQAQLHGKTLDLKSLQPADLAMKVRPVVLDMDESDGGKWKGATSGVASSGTWMDGPYVPYTGDSGGSWKSSGWQEKKGWQDDDWRKPAAKKEQKPASSGWSTQGQRGWNWKTAAATWAASSQGGWSMSIPTCPSEDRTISHDEDERYWFFVAGCLIILWLFTMFALSCLCCKAVARRCRGDGASGLVRPKARAQPTVPPLVLPAPSGPSTKACFNWAKGTCKFGANCIYVHSGPPGTPVVTYSADEY